MWQKWIVCDHSRYRLGDSFGRIKVYEIGFAYFKRLLDEHDFEIRVTSIESAGILDDLVDEDVHLETGAVRENCPHCAVLIEPSRIEKEGLAPARLWLVTYEPWVEDWWRVGD